MDTSHLSDCFCVWLSVYLSILLSVSLPICPSYSLHPSIRPSTCLCDHVLSTPRYPALDSSLHSDLTLCQSLCYCVLSGSHGNGRPWSRAEPFAAPHWKDVVNFCRSPSLYLYILSFFCLPLSLSHFAFCHSPSLNIFVFLTFRLSHSLTNNISHF